jgi:hypothetical protein
MRFCIMLFLLINSASAVTNATFYMADGSKREAEFISYKNGIVTVKIKAPNGELYVSELPKNLFQKIELFDWRIVDFSLDEWPPPKSGQSVPEKKGTAGQPAPSPLLEDVVVMMKDGSIVEGKKKSETDSYVVIVVNGADVPLSKTLIDTVISTSQISNSASSVAQTPTPASVVVMMKDGSVVEGKRISEDMTAVVIETDGANISLMMDKIDTIVAASGNGGYTGNELDNGSVQSEPPAEEYVYEEIFEDDKNATAEAGAYERKSVSLLSALLLADQSAAALSNEQVGHYLMKMNKTLSLKRFDYNPLPPKLQAQFVEYANRRLAQLPPPDPNPLKKEKGPSATAKVIGAAIDSVLLPEILRGVDLEKEMRLAGYLTSAQKNSFINDKAKQLGYTASQLHRLMNSAYLYVPYVARLSSMEKDGKVMCKMNMGLIWYRIITKGEKAKAVATVTKETMSIGMASLSPLMSEGLPVSSQEYAFRSSVKNGSRNLLVATQEMPEFRLSSQVGFKHGGKVDFLLGKKEGILVDDKYRIVEFWEQEDGSVTQKNNGWVSVTKIADNRTEEVASTAKIRGGRPVTGVVISEFPRIPIDIVFAGHILPNMKSNGLNALSLGFGPLIGARYNIGRLIRIRQLFFNLSIPFAWSGTMNDYKLSNKSGAPASRSSLDLSLVKKFWARSVYFAVEAGYQSIGGTIPKPDWYGGDDPISDSDQNTKWEERFDGNGFLLGLYGGVAFGPRISMEIAGRYTVGSAEGTIVPMDAERGTTGFNNDGPLKWKGWGISLGFVWSPPSLPFDPIDMVRAASGI